MFEWMFLLEGWFALATLIILEIILGVDNIIFLTIVVAKLPENQQDKARRIGLLGAMCMRILLLLSLSWLTHLTLPLFTLYQGDFHFSSRATFTQNAFLFSIKDAILLLGGLFLVYKGFTEIKEMLQPSLQKTAKIHSISFLRAIIQIILLDIVFSLDSVITAVGLSGDHLMIMILAIIISVLMMLFCAKWIGDFVNQHPNIKMLAIAFLILVGSMLILEGFHIAVSKNYLYFALFFALAVELLNYWRDKKLIKRIK